MKEASVASAHVDTFARDRLPPRELWPRMDYAALPELAGYPEPLNAATALLDETAATHGHRPAFRYGGTVWSYAELKARSNRIARVLVEDHGMVAGERVLLRGPNNLMMVACWFAVLKAGGICVTTMPMLRARELAAIANKAAVRIALCDVRLAEDMEAARKDTPSLERIALFTATGDGGDSDADLDAAAARQGDTFAPVETAAGDVALIAFTSGTTGAPKGTVHFHRDILASADMVARRSYDIGPDDVFCATPPFAFTFGLGALVFFPMRVGASSVLVERFAPDTLLETVSRYRCTGVYTSPTGYRSMSDQVARFDLSSLRMCVSAGEHLPQATWQAWHEATGLGILDGIGATEMLHIFISAHRSAIRPGSTGRPVAGYAAMVVDDDFNEMPAGEPGRLAVRGPTGCRYLDDVERQQAYVQQGWNLTGDVFRRDEDGYFWYVARTDDMIISGGYNIAGPEVENALLLHPAVQECAVVGAPDERRTSIVKAFVVLRKDAARAETLTRELQDFVKGQIAPYKYPRAIEFVDSLPKTATGKLQRYALRK